MTYTQFLHRSCFQAELGSILKCNLQMLADLENIDRVAFGQSTNNQMKNYFFKNIQIFNRKLLSKN